jgi:hypothetical protein
MNDVLFFFASHFAKSSIRKKNKEGSSEKVHVALFQRRDTPGLCACVEELLCCTAVAKTWLDPGSSRRPAFQMNARGGSTAPCQKMPDEPG